jgi:hypothetical protein
MRLGPDSRIWEFYDLLRASRAGGVPVIFCGKTAQMGVDCGFELLSSAIRKHPKFQPSPRTSENVHQLCAKSDSPRHFLPKVPVGDDAIQAAQSAFL